MSITPAGVALTLVSDETEQELHLMIGPAEGQAIVRALRHAQLDRPQTHDLMKTLVEAGGWSVSRVIIRDLRNQTYYADIVLQRPGAFGLEGNVEEMTIDARPSDAMALGLRFDAKIFVRQSVFDAEQKNLERDEPEEMVNPDEPETLTI
jgi:bifunctional DNase/RNase